MTTPTTASTQDTLDLDVPMRTDDNQDFGTNVGQIIEQQTASDEFGAQVTANEDMYGSERRLPFNVGTTERTIRLAAGTGMLAAAAFAPIGRNWRIALGILGAMEIATGSARYCPLWHALGVNTNRSGQAELA